MRTFVSTNTLSRMPLFARRPDCPAEAEALFEQSDRTALRGLVGRVLGDQPGDVLREEPADGGPLLGSERLGPANRLLVEAEGDVLLLLDGHIEIVRAARAARKIRAKADRRRSASSCCRPCRWRPGSRARGRRRRPGRAPSWCW